MNPIVYVLPVHNEERLLKSNVERLAAHLATWQGAEIFLVENGSRDASWEIAQSLERTSERGVSVRAFRESNAGIGYAYDRGLREALSLFGPDDRRWVILTAADLPFGVSDLDAALIPMERSPSRILMGSKAHAASKVDTGTKRRVMSFAYRFARRASLGMHVGDSQGSIFLRLDLASELAPRVEARGFFYSTELCYFAERAGEKIDELPVKLEAERRASTVRPLHDGAEMAMQLWALRRRQR